MYKSVENVNPPPNHTRGCAARLGFRVRVWGAAGRRRPAGRDGRASQNCQRRMLWRHHSKEHVLIVGGTGRTGRKLVHKLCEDPRISEVTAIVRDPVKAQHCFGADHEKINIVEGDLTDVGAWEARLDGVSQVVTAVSCGLSTDWLVVLGVKDPESPLPSDVDGDGITQLAHAAKAHGVERFVAVTTASAGSPWSLAAMFLNLIHHGSVQEKWRGEQAIRSSGLDYIILRPYGLGQDVAPPPGARGIEWSQGRTSGARRRIPRDDVATLCHEALLLDKTARRTTFECWASEEHARPMDWSALRPDPPGPLPEVDHRTATAVALCGTLLLGGAALRGVGRMRRFALLAGKTAPDAADARFFGHPAVHAAWWGIVGYSLWKAHTDGFDPEAKGRKTKSPQQRADEALEKWRK